MGDITKSLFGGGETEPELVGVPRVSPVQPTVELPFGTGFQVSGGALTPTLSFTGFGGAEALGQEVLGLTRDQLAQVQADIETTRALENPFIEAIRTPFNLERQRLASDEAALTRDFARRGVFGTLREQAKAPISLAREQLATQEAGAVTTGQLQVQELIGQQQELQRALTADITGQQRLQLETSLAALGLSNEAIQNLIASQFPVGEVSTESETFGGIFEPIPLFS